MFSSLPPLVLETAQEGAVRVFLDVVAVGDHAEHGQAELFLDVFGRADFAVEHGVSDDGADADEQAEHGHDGHDEHFARLDGLVGQGRLVDDLDLIRHHDLGDLCLLEALGQHDVDLVRHVDVALDAHITLFLLGQGLDELFVFGVHRVERGLLALGDGDGCLILELVGEQALLDRARGRRLLGDDLADLFIEGLAGLGDLVVDLLDFRVLVGVLADVARARALELGELVLVLLDGWAVGDRDARALELAVDARKACLSGLEVELVGGLLLVDEVELVGDLLHLVVSRVHLVLGLVLLELVLSLRQLFLGIAEALLEEFARVLLLLMAQVGEALDEALDEHLIGLLGLLGRLTRHGDLQDLGVLVGLCRDVRLHIVLIRRQLALLVGLLRRLDDGQDDVAALEDLRIGHHALLVAHRVARGQAREDGVTEALLLLDAQQGVGLIYGLCHKEIGATCCHEGGRDGSDLLLVGQDDLRDLLEVDGDFFQDSIPSTIVPCVPCLMSIWRSIVVLDLRDHVDAVEDRRDVTAKVDAVVPRHVEDIALAHDVVLAHVAGAQHVVEVDGDQGLRLVLVNQEDLLLGRVAREALGRADGVHDRVCLFKLNGARLLDLAENVDADGAELRDVDGDIRVDDVAREAIGDGIRELVDRHALGVDLADERERDIAVGTHGERRLVGRGIAEILLLGHDDTQLVAGTQQVVGRAQGPCRICVCISLTHRGCVISRLGDGAGAWGGVCGAARHLGGYLTRVH